MNNSIIASSNKYCFVKIILFLFKKSHFAIVINLIITFDEDFSIIIANFTFNVFDFIFDENFLIIIANFTFNAFNFIFDKSFLIIIINLFLMFMILFSIKIS